MKTLVLVALSLTACVLDAGDPAPSVESPTPGVTARTNCDDWMCGTNSPVIDGFGFHELNIEGKPNLEGFVLGAVVKDQPRGPLELGSSRYRMYVINGAIVGVKIAGPASDPDELKNAALTNARIVLERAGKVYEMVIVDVQEETPYWAHLAHATPVFETYQFGWRPLDDGDRPQQVCASPNASDILTMNTYNAVVFEGERIDAAKKAIDPALDKYWFNVGCAGSTLAKLQLTGHTEASEADGFSTTIDERQTMLKMLSADYSGTGQPFTVAGQPLRWADDHGTMTVDPLGNALEAEWTPKGASCLNTPRLTANSTPNGQTYFPYTPGELLTQIKTACGGALPPPCTSTPTMHLRSYNPGLIIIPSP